MKDLPSSSGRLDVVCRCSIASLLDNQRIRTDTTFIAVLEGGTRAPLCLEFDGKEIRTIPFSEIAVAGLLRRVLSDGCESGKKHPVPYWKGVSIERESFAELLHHSLATGGLYYLHERGEDIRNVNFDLECDDTFVLGDQKGLSPQEESMLDGLRARRVSVGPLSYLSSQVITLTQDELDRRRPRV